MQFSTGSGGPDEEEEGEEEVRGVETTTKLKNENGCIERERESEEDRRMEREDERAEIWR